MYVIRFEGVDSLEFPEKKAFNYNTVVYSNERKIIRMYCIFYLYVILWFLVHFYIRDINFCYYIYVAEFTKRTVCITILIFTVVES